MATKNKIKISDYDRVLITETLPYETPIIFSNDGLYDRVKKYANASEFERLLLDTLVFGKKALNVKTKKLTKPYLYKIRKNSLEYRRLALLHPLSQWKIRKFYKEYDNIILYFCSVSPASIRTPTSIASTFYSKSSWENIYEYKSGVVTSSNLEKYAKHTPSYFSYKGYDRLYKFFGSQDYFNLEKRFQVQMTLDVSKCFDSIYTHTMAWATKEKEFAKENTNLKSFGDDFDVMIRHGNYNETNGIPIGPEVSRLFSEIIFQKIDTKVINRLLEEDLEYGINYVFRRYVDDVYIFGGDESLTKNIYSVYSDELMKFNLHTNKAKSAIQHRPFVSKKSRLIYDAINLSNSFFDSFLISTEPGHLAPKPIRSSWKVASSFIDSIKNICAYNEVDYNEVSSFLIASIAERVKRLVNIKEEIPDNEKRNYHQAVRIILEVVFFLYSVAPSVSASFKLGTVIILFVRFTENHMISYTDEVSSKIYDLASQLLIGVPLRSDSDSVQGFVNLESLNILLAVRELGEPYLIPESIIERIFSKLESPSYFTITSCLFYIRDSNKYETIHQKLLNHLENQFTSLDDILINSEKAHLFLDILSCPYIPINSRKKWIKAFTKKANVQAIKAIEMVGIIDKIGENHWFINWSNVDLLNLLEKKELKQAY